MGSIRSRMGVAAIATGLGCGGVEASGGGLCVGRWYVVSGVSVGMASLGIGWDCGEVEALCVYP